MKKYLKMGDAFDCEVESDAYLMYSDSLGNIADFSGYKTQCRYAAHAINSHDELVAEVERLSGMVQDAFIDGCHAGWDMSGEGYNAEYGGPDDGAMHDMFVTKSMEWNKGA
jgi:hypothetical protein